jgi:hypothetical protein
MTRRRITLGFIIYLCYFLLVSPVAVSAQATGLTTINGTVTETISITVPGTFNIGNLVPEQVISSAQTVIVTSNTTGWSLKVKEDGASPDGRMARTTDAKALTGTMEVKGGEQTGYASLASEVTLKSGATTSSATINDIYFRQYVSASDEAGLYTITLIFTASPS